MCNACLSRRSFLSLAAAGSVSACDGPPDLVPDAQVEAMGLQAWEQMRAETPASRNAEYQGALDAVSRRLLEEQNQRPQDWEVVVFASPQINAFALPGRKIGIYEGMFGVVQNTDQLAAIVGHEIGHLAAEHAQKRMSAQVAKSMGVRLLAWVLNVGGVEYGNEIAAALGLGVEVGLLLPYSRDHELEADRFGLQAMAGAGFRPEEAVTLWQRMQAAQGNRGPEFLATHPTPDSRIEQIEEILQTI